MLTADVVRVRCEASAATAAAAGALVLSQTGRMPAHLRWPLRLATLGFAVASALRTGRLYHAAPAPARGAQRARWRAARLAPCRDLMRFYESLAVFACFAVEERDGA